MIIAIPTGVKIFNWLFTLYGGTHPLLPVPLMWAIGFMVTFVIGGLTGVLMAVPPADFVLHNSVFLVAHFHNVIIGGVVFGAMAGYNYWFPKAFGFTAATSGSARRSASGAGSSASTSRSCRCTALGLPGHDPPHAALRRDASVAVLI